MDEIEDPQLCHWRLDLELILSRCQVCVVPSHLSFSISHLLLSITLLQSSPKTLLQWWSSTQLYREFQQMYLDNANPMKLILRIKKIQE
ncbi:hypothetical protein DVH24_002126 [Malus domestica]|uniref:Uncharacterized protein n=1 Tax=Malus domestica TaxID=3750 RepID=A0A498I4D8_MALDO|nr:hypothetical protein DVH24_002126 [Malus domestica]